MCKYLTERQANRARNAAGFKPESNTSLDEAIAQSIAYRQTLSLVDFIRDVEARHFRTGHDTGANRNALFVWNQLREYAGLERLTWRDLVQRHADDNGVTLDEMLEDYRLLEEMQQQRNIGFRGY